MGSSLIRGRYVLPGAASGVASVIEDGAVLERDGTIVEVGPAAALAHHAVDRILGSPGHVVLPGFVNGHHHVGLTPFQLGSPDLPLELWFVSRMAARDVDPYLDTLYSAFDMLESGITTVQHLHGWRGAPAARVFGVAERILQAYADVGMRVSYSYALRDQNRLVYEADEDFCRRLPSALGAEMREYLAAQSIPLPDHLGLFVDLWERVGRNAGPLARVQLAPGNLHWCSDEALGALRDYAEKYDVGLHMHLVETPFQRIYAERRTGTTALRHLERLGLLGPRLTLGHGVWLTEDDIALAADTGTMICHNASSNLRLRSGVAPLNRFRARGLRVGLGLDEAGNNDDRDMWQEMRLVLRLHREPGMDDGVPTSAGVFEMATAGGAATTGFGAAIGRLAPGAAADLVLLPWASLATPYLDPVTTPIDALVHRARAGHVETVMVAGEVVLDRGRFTRVDRAAAMAELAARLGTPLGPAEERRRRLARDVFPHVRRFYDGWLDALPRDPFYAPSSRR
jgi:cytosine/adenosine deaminase-related metal-dependent hydrolase